ncbi:cation diffusion facilitator family transporter [Microvirga arsenatis]|uniref:Cation diffusion facilitator family transporter n=1 Tax=Microvirga arsenatis TaxID=2692265 RepID=A0ABW9YWT0_9HYPH|nr:cation diffusion facilitator family transporter [Microvirga arsenatis]NBJ10337.1 cation diffusion facilitator family transporter [Microvirga arsenatis]NBJ24764.1 cation diffusion facilitator family transporter [Microvirga arsenatis]
MDKVQRLAIGSIFVGTAVFVLKYAAYYITGSIALFSDALESIINMVTAVAAFLAVRVSAAPADANHPYGHHKVEYFSAVLEGVLIIVAALAILREAYLGLMTPKIVDAPMEGLALNAIAGVINAAWSWTLIRRGRRLRSPALVADGRHLLTDVVTSAGVLVGLLLVPVTGWHWLDPALAAVVAVNILWSGWGLMKESIGGLMDEALPEATLARVREIIAKNAEGAIEAHDLRTRHAGRMTFIDFHLVVPGAMSVTEAHEICDRLERALKADVEDALITIHVEPDDKAKHAGIVVL